MATSTISWVLLVATTFGATHASDAVNLLETSDVFGALVTRMRNNPDQLISWDDETIDTLTDVTPCSVPNNPDPRYYYPDFPECRQRNCPDCKPVNGLSAIPDWKTPKDEPRPSKVPDMYKPQVQPRPTSVPDVFKPEVSHRSSSVPDFSRPQVQPRPPLVPDYSNFLIQPRPLSWPGYSKPKVEPQPPSVYDFSEPQIQPRPTSFSDYSQPQVQPRRPSGPDYSRAQVQPLPISTPDLYRPQIEPMPPQIQDYPLNQVANSNRNIPETDPVRMYAPQPSSGSQYYMPNPYCPTQPIITYPPSCPRETFIANAVPPHQCPAGVPGRVSDDQIRKIIIDGGYCRDKATECSASVSELLLRLTLLEDRLRALVKCETQLQVYTNMLAQIKQKIGETIQGNVGPPGEEGYMGQRGGRGGRGPPGQCSIQGGTPGGTPGPPGPVGSKGEHGPPGDKICDCDGLQGPSGFPGYPFTGNPGPKGMKGQSGPRGQDINPMDI